MKSVNKTQAVVSLSGDENLTVGAEVYFLTADLSNAGRGKVTKISAGGKNALVEITEGHVNKGMTVEKIEHSGDKVHSNTTPPVQTDVYSTLSKEEREILARGEISTAQHIIGGVLGTWPVGLGLGHAVQGRYTDKGWIFTVGELGSLAVILAGIGDCWDDDNDYDYCGSNGLILIGLGGYIGFRIWEIFDVWAAPGEINQRYRSLKYRMESRGVTLQPALIPLADGGMFGLKMTF